jgi:hypothetical protein
VIWLLLWFAVGIITIGVLCDWHPESVLNYLTGDTLFFFLVLFFGPVMLFLQQLAFIYLVHRWRQERKKR